MFFPKETFVGLGPPRGEPAGHPERADRLRVLARGVREHLPVSAAFHGALGGRSRLPLALQRQRYDGTCSAERSQADHRMEQEQHDQEHRHPRHVEKRRRSDARQKGADLVEIAQRLLGQQWACALQGKGGEREMDRLLQARVEQ